MKNSEIVQLINNKKQQQQKINIYLCGPTVYDDIHFGNLRSIIIFDVLVRILKINKIDFLYVQGITDIDDKIIKKSLDKKTSENFISEKYFKNFCQILKKMNVIFPHAFPKVTENINEIQNIIKELINQKNAYLEDGNVLFDITKFDEYYEISKQKKNFLLNPKNLNFTLWKKDLNNNFWNSPWGKGRPGWHIECFAFIQKYFNFDLDIHGGGVDLKFPHHENENIISRSIYKKTISKFWIHVGHVKMNGEKISKSDKNLNLKFKVKKLLKKYDSSFLRYVFFTSNNYKKPLEINEIVLDNLYKNWISIIQKIKSIILFLYSNNKKNFIYEENLKNFNIFKFEENNNFDWNILKYWENIILKIKLILKMKKEFEEATKKKLTNCNINLIYQNFVELLYMLEILGFNLRYKILLNNENDLFKNNSENLIVKSNDVFWKLFDKLIIKIQNLLKKEKKQ